MTEEWYRLPSEAEWEYACRAGTTTAFSTGDTISTHQANFDGGFIPGTLERDAWDMTTPVDQHSPNPFGLFDMHGNVLELCADAWHKDYEGAPANGSIWLEAGDVLRSPVRGGSWYGELRVSRSAWRDSNPRADRSNMVGFRIFRAIC